jgi:hypothetical protein
VTLYVENLSVKSFLFQILGGVFFAKLRSSNVNIHYYIDASARGKVIAHFLGKIFRFEFKQLKFELRYIKDERGELVRLRLPRQDLFEFQDQIVNSPAYKALFNSEWLNNRSHDFIRKGLTQGAIWNKESVTRALFFIHVVSWHMKKLGEAESKMFMRKRAWWYLYERCALKFGISLRPLNPVKYSKMKSFRINREFLVSVLKRYPRLFYFLKRVRNIVKDRALEEVIVPEKGEFKNSHYDYTPRLYVFGRGDVNLKNNGYHSDFFWLLNSDFPPKNILYEYHSLEEKLQLEQNGITPINRNAGGSYRKSINYIPMPLESDSYKDERETLKNLVKSYNATKSRWVNFFQTHGVKVYLTWFKFDHINMAIADAVEYVGGICAIWQMAFSGFPASNCFTDTDIVFSFSEWSVKIDNKLQSKIKYNVITGYLKDYAAPLVKNEAMSLRKKLELKGAKKIVFAIDENSIDDSRWHTGHSMQRENYSFILEKVLQTPWLGVVFKPKTAKTLRNRLGEVNDILVRAEETGRCYIFESSGQYTTLASPLLAGLSADICIHGHLSSGTAALECALENIPTLLIDREGCPDSKLYDLPEGKVIFKDWPEAIDAVMEHFQTDDGIPGFGDWSSIIDELDPFRDGKAATRMGTYLHWLIQGFEEGLDRETILADAADRYCRKWGYDKISAV